MNPWPGRYGLDPSSSISLEESTEAVAFSGRLRASVLQATEPLLRTLLLEISPHMVVFSLMLELFIVTKTSHAKILCLMVLLWKTQFMIFWGLISTLWPTQKEQLQTPLQVLTWPLKVTTTLKLIYHLTILNYWKQFWQIQSRLWRESRGFCFQVCTWFEQVKIIE